MSRSASTFSVRQVRHIHGEISVPGDKSLSHRAVLLAALADGTTNITGFLPGEDCLCTMRALQAMGCVIEVISDTELRVHGTGGKLQPPLEPLECGNSGTAMRLIAGVLAAQPVQEPPDRRRIAFEPANEAHCRSAAPDGRKNPGPRRQAHRAAGDRGRPAHGYRVHAARRQRAVEIVHSPRRAFRAGDDERD